MSSTTSIPTPAKTINPATTGQVHAQASKLGIHHRSGPEVPTALQNPKGTGPKDKTYRARYIGLFRYRRGLKVRHEHCA